MQSYSSPQPTQHVTYNNSSTSITAKDFYQAGALHEKQYDLGSACRYYYLAAEAGLSDGERALVRLIKQHNFNARLRTRYVLKLAVILADPQHPLFDEHRVKRWMPEKGSLERNNRHILEVVLSNNNLFRLSPYFSQDGNPLFNLAKQSPNVCKLIAKHDHLARTLKGSHFASLSEFFSDIPSGYISDALKAYHYFSELADSPADTEVPFQPTATDGLAQQLRIAGLNTSQLTRLGKRFFPIAMAICHNRNIGSDFILMETALHYEKAKTDPNLLILAALELPHHYDSPRDRNRNVRWKALLYARAASLGSKPALDKLRYLNRINHNQFAILVNLCDADHELGLFAKNKNIARSVNDADEDVLHDCLSLLQGTCAEHHSSQWQLVIDLIKQLRNLPDHFSIKYIIYKKLISIFLQPNIKTKLSDTLNGLLIYDDDIELLNKVVQAVLLADIIEDKARSLRTKNVDDFNILSEIVIHFVNFYKQDLSTTRSDYQTHFFKYIDDTLPLIKNDDVKDFLKDVKQELIEIFRDNIQAHFSIEKLT